jgi:uncharacterized membrane protein
VKKKQSPRADLAPGEAVVFAVSQVLSWPVLFFLAGVLGILGAVRWPDGAGFAFCMVFAILGTGALFLWMGYAVLETVRRVWRRQR